MPKFYKIEKDKEPVYYGFKDRVIKFFKTKIPDFDEKNWIESIKKHDYQIFDYPYYLKAEETDEFIKIFSKTDECTYDRRIIQEGMKRHDPHTLNILRTEKKTWSIPELRELEGWDHHPSLTEL